MIVYGTRGREIKGPVVNDITCPNCGKTEHSLFGIMRYFHVFWIPTVPTSRKAGAVCHHCNAAVMGEDMSENTAQRIKGMVFNMKNTLPMFTGLILLLCLAGFALWGAQESSKQKQAYLAAPQTGDIYAVNLQQFFPDVDTDGYKYGALKVAETTPEKISFMVGNTAYNKISGVNKAIRKGKANRKDYFGDAVVEFSAEELTVLNNKGAIRNVFRD